MAKAIQKINPFKPKTQPVRGCFHLGHSQSPEEGEAHFSKEAVSGKQMIAAMLKYIWPADDKLTRDRVKLSMGLLISAKLLNVCAPFIFKYAVDYLNAANTLNMSTPQDTIITVTTSLLIGCRYNYYKCRPITY